MSFLQSRIFPKLLESAAFVLSPKECLGCGASHVWLCDQCQASQLTKLDWCCPICRKLSSQGQRCSACSSYLDALVVPWSNTSLMRKIILAWKHQKAHQLTDVVGELMWQGLYDYEWPTRKIAFVPLSKSRLNWRGFDQVACLANFLTNQANVKICDVLIKTKERPPQAKMSFGDRFMTLEGLYEAKEKVYGDYILLDDVVTTGATMEACAAALKSAGASKVYGLALARGKG